MILLVLLPCTCLYSFELAKAKVTIRVVDEEGLPVSEAKVTGGFFAIDELNEGKDFQGMTDEKGIVSFEGRTHGELSYRAVKEGYYPTSSEYRDWFLGKGEIKKGKWHPWNPTIEVLLRKIKNPVPMYAKRLTIDVPEKSAIIGFDLIKGDWVKPYGKGEISDFLFQATQTGDDWKNFEISLKLTFSNPKDGIQVYKVNADSNEDFPSQLKLPYKAPLEGYKYSWSRKQGNNPETGTYNIKKEKNINYIYRVRTALDSNGNVVKALYGKIHGDFEIGGLKRPKLQLAFTYYLNPDGTRNLEFDPKRNLFEGLSSLEEVTEP
ncbi:MAG: carboxypeptidase regulatory-like domain-containing protein [Candidatus Aureabacteria bacterium]|nr:carboxypeptidase regulatory-like domain-containing protein [Candidatus Auribacterota bacterium]